MGNLDHQGHLDLREHPSLELTGAHRVSYHHKHTNIQDEISVQANLSSV